MVRGRNAFRGAGVSLRLRIGVAVGVVLAGLVVTLAVIIWAFSVKAVSEAEVREAEKDLARVEKSLQGALSSLQILVRDWAFWDDTFEFVATQNPAYAEENLGAYVFETFDADVLLITDLQRSLVYAAAYDAALEEAVPVDGPTLDALLGRPFLFSSARTPVDEAGYVVLPEGPAQVVTAPVSFGGGEVNGTFLAVRYLDAAFVSGLEADTLVEASLLAGATSPNTPPVDVAEDTVRVSGALPMLAGSAPLQVVVSHPRALYRHGVRGAGALVLLLVTISLAFGVLTLLFVERLLLARLTHLSRWVNQATQRGDLNGRIEVVGVDEIAQLGGHINGLLEALQTSFRRLEKSEARYSVVAEGVNDGLWDWNLTNGEVYYSSRWFKLLGSDEDDQVGTTDTWQARVHPDDEPRVRQKLEAHIAGGNEFFEDEHRLQTKTGGYLWVLVRGKTVYSAAGVPERIAGSLTDISTRGVFDPLTGLPNRLMLQGRLEELFGRDTRFGRAHASLLFMDVNRFKFVNDSLGHAVGDLLLLELAARLQSCVRGDDLVARLSGDEFVVLLSETPAEGVASVVARIERRVAERFDLEGEELYTSVSIGVVEDLLACEDPKMVLERADAAMYEAKRGGAAHLYYDERMLADALATHRLETELRRALGNGELYLHYQPIVNLRSGAVTGAEALLRWHHPERGFVSPAEFIPAAEDSGLIVPIGLWVLEEACRTLAAHPELDEAFTVSVNLSSRQLLQPELVGDVKSILLKTALNPRRLKLEITETAVIESTSSVLSPLEELRALGVQIVMDDFGTGYSSLTYLQNLPIDVLKLDRSFIQNMSEDERTREIVGTIVSLARTLSLNLVAEGIETVDELGLLRDFSCPYGQGYLFSRPAPMSEVVRLALEGSAQDITAQKTIEGTERILS